MSNENFIQAAPGPWRIDSGLGIEDAEGRGVGRVYRHGTRIEGTDTDVATALLIGAAPLLLAACEAADLALADILMDCEELIESPTLVAALDALSVALDTSRVPTAKARARWGEFAAASGLST